MDSWLFALMYLYCSESLLREECCSLSTGFSYIDYNQEPPPPKKKDKPTGQHGLHNYSLRLSSQVILGCETSLKLTSILTDMPRVCLIGDSRFSQVDNHY